MPIMRFIHCQKCGTTERVVHEDREARAFRAAHEACRLETFEATGRGEASSAWYEPMATRRLEVRGTDGLALAIGARRLLDEPVVWRIERRETEEETEIELDREMFLAAVEQALSPSRLPQRTIEMWAAQIEHFARGTNPAEIILLEDDPQSGNVTYACLTVTARAKLEADLETFGFDRDTETKLAALFDEELFPPIRVRRHLVRADGLPAATETGEDTLTRAPRLV